MTPEQIDAERKRRQDVIDQRFESLSDLVQEFTDGAQEFTDGAQDLPRAVGRTARMSAVSNLHAARLWAKTAVTLVSDREIERQVAEQAELARVDQGKVDIERAGGPPVGRGWRL